MLTDPHFPRLNHRHTTIIPHTNVLQKFANNLSKNMSYITICDDIHCLFNGHLQDLPTFKEVVDCVMNTHFNYLHMHSNAFLIPDHVHPTTDSLSTNTVVSLLEFTLFAPTPTVERLAT